MPLGSHVNELQLKLAERRSVVEGCTTIEGASVHTSNHSTLSHRPLIMHRRGSQVVAPNTPAASADGSTTTRRTIGRIPKKEYDSPPHNIVVVPATQAHNSVTKTDVSSSSTPAVGNYEFLKVLQSLRRTDDSDGSTNNSEIKRRQDMMKTNTDHQRQQQPDDDQTAVTISCSTSLSASTRGRTTTEMSVSSILGPLQQSSYYDDESAPIKRPPLSPTATKALLSMKTSSLSPPISTNFSNFEATKSNNNYLQSSTAAQVPRYSRNDGAISPKPAKVTTPKMTQYKQSQPTPPNAPDRSISSHKKAQKSSNRSLNGSPRHFLDETQNTAGNNDDISNDDDASVDSVSGEFRTAAKTYTPGLVEDEFQKHQCGDNDKCLIEVKPSGYGSVLSSHGEEELLWDRETNRRNTERRRSTFGTNQSNSSNPYTPERRLHVETSVGKHLVPPHMSDDWENDRMGNPSNSSHVDWPDNENFENSRQQYPQFTANHNQENRSSSRTPSMAPKRTTYTLSLPPLVQQAHEDNSRHELVGRNIITSQSQDSCSTFAFSSPSSKDIPSIRYSLGRESATSSSSVPSGLTINVLYKEIMKVRLQMEDTQRADAIKMEQLSIENRALRGQLEEERARTIEKDRIIHTERERVAEKEQIIREERARVAEKERMIVELLQKLQEKAQESSRSGYTTPRRSPIRNREESISPRSTSSSRRREASSTKSQAKPVRNEVRLEDRRFEC